MPFDRLRAFGGMPFDAAQGLRRDEVMGVKRNCPLNTRKLAKMERIEL